MISWSLTWRTTPSQKSSARRHFLRFTGRLISMAEAIVEALQLLARRGGRSTSAVTSMSGRPSRQDRPWWPTSCVERPGAGGVDDRQARDPVDQAEVLQLDERLAEGARVAEVAAGHDDPVGGLPAEGLEDPVHDRLLAFEAERVDRVHQVDAQPVGDLADPLHRVVEVADDLDRQGAVVERLGQLAVGDLARADEDDRLEAEVGRRAVDGQRRRGVARAGAGDPPGARPSGRG